MKLDTNVYHDIPNKFRMGDTPKSHVIADISTFLLGNQLSQISTYYIPLERKFDVDSKKELSHIVKINLWRVIGAQSEQNDVIKILLENVFFQTLSYYIPLERKFNADSEKELSRIVKINLWRVIGAQSEQNDVIKILLEIVFFQTLSYYIPLERKFNADSEKELFFTLKIKC